MATATQRTSLTLISSTTPQDLWSHPTLNLYPVEIPQHRPQEALLYTTPTTFGEIFDEDDRPTPTSASELPDIHRWTMSFATNLLEIMAGRRTPSQLAPRCHRVMFLRLAAMAGSTSEIGRIRRIHQDFPLDGICESVITVAFGERMRALVIRTEGVDGKWLCTAVRLL
ncbi:MAG: hypothetical protein RL428_415 [Actinomycetota bacterium]|jgi:hypothetical protein